jgi:hypothetical protein
MKMSLLPKSVSRTKTIFRVLSTIFFVEGCVVGRGLQRDVVYLC